MTVTDLHLVRGGDRALPDRRTDRQDAEALLVPLRDACGAEYRARYARVVEHHLPLVDAIAARYRGRGVEEDDLVQVGRLGLCKAINGYRPEKGHGFLAYAVPTITGEIKRHFRDTVWTVRPPRRVQELHAQIREEQIALTQRLGHHPSDGELASVTGVDEASLRQTRLAQEMSSTVSIDGPSELGRPWSERLATDSDDYAALEARLVLQPALQALTRRQRRIVYLRFVRCWSQREIGDALGVSQMQISRLLEQILSTLRERIVPLDRAG